MRPPDEKNLVSCTHQATALWPTSLPMLPALVALTTCFRSNAISILGGGTIFDDCGWMHESCGREMAEISTYCVY